MNYQWKFFEGLSPQKASQVWSDVKSPSKTSWIKMVLVFNQFLPLGCAVTRTRTFEWDNAVRFCTSTHRHITLCLYSKTFCINRSNKVRITAWNVPCRRRDKHSGLYKYFLQQILLTFWSNLVHSHICLNYLFQEVTITKSSI